MSENGGRSPAGEVVSAAAGTGSEEQQTTVCVFLFFAWVGLCVFVFQRCAVGGGAHQIGYKPSLLQAAG